MTPIIATSVGVLFFIIGIGLAALLGEGYTIDQRTRQRRNHDRGGRRIEDRFPGLTRRHLLQRG